MKLRSGVLFSSQKSRSDVSDLVSTVLDDEFRCPVEPHYPSISPGPTRDTFNSLPSAMTLGRPGSVTKGEGGVPNRIKGQG